MEWVMLRSDTECVTRGIPENRKADQDHFLYCFLCVEGACIHGLSWYRTQLIGLDPSRNKCYSLCQLHVLWQLHACTQSGWHCLPYGSHKTSPSTFHQLNRQLQLPGTLSCDTMLAALGPKLSFPTLGMMRLGRSQLTKSFSSGKLLCSEYGT